MRFSSIFTTSIVILISIIIIGSVFYIHREKEKERTAKNSILLNNSDYSDLGYYIQTTLSIQTVMARRAGSNKTEGIPDAHYLILRTEKMGRNLVRVDYEIRLKYKARTSTKSYTKFFERKTDGKWSIKQKK